MKIKKRYFLIPLLVTGLILCISPFIFRVHAYSNKLQVPLDSSYIIWLSPDTQTFLESQVVERPVIKLHDSLNNTDFTLVSIYNSGTTETNYPYHLKFYNFSNYEEVVDVYTDDGYLFIYYDFAVKAFHIYQAYYNTDMTLEISNSSKIKTISVSYELSHDPFNYIDFYGYFVGYSSVGLTSFNLSNVNDVLHYFSINPYEGSQFINAYNNAYSEAFNAGYAAGQAGETAVTPFFTVISGVFTVVDSILSVEIIPHVKLWYFIAVPLFFLILWAVLKIWKHN